MHPATTTQTRREASLRRRRGARRRGRGDAGDADPGGGGRDRHERRRPARGDVDRATVDLIARRGAEIVAAARRYAATPEDADDAYQRGLEILLSKAPSTSEDDPSPLAEDGRQARGVRAPSPACAPRAGDGRRRARRARHPGRRHARPGRTLRAAAPGGGGDAPAQAPGDPGRAAEGRGLLVREDLRDHRLVLYQGQSSLDRRPSGARHQARRHPRRDRVREAGAAALRPGGRRGERRGRRRPAAALENLPRLSRAATGFAPRRSGWRRWSRPSLSRPATAASCARSSSPRSARRSTRRRCWVSAPRPPRSWSVRTRSRHRRRRWRAAARRWISSRTTRGRRQPTPPRRSGGGEAGQGGGAGRSGSAGARSGRRGTTCHRARPSRAAGGHHQCRRLRRHPTWPPSSRRLRQLLPRRRPRRPAQLPRRANRPVREASSRP
jgi:hypothetical protein